MKKIVVGCLKTKNKKVDTKKEIPLVRGHCHLKGKFRGFAHDECNLGTWKKIYHFWQYFAKTFPETIVI